MASSSSSSAALEHVVDAQATVVPRAGRKGEQELVPAVVDRRLGGCVQTARLRMERSISGRPQLQAVALPGRRDAVGQKPPSRQLQRQRRAGARGRGHEKESSTHDPVGVLHDVGEAEPDGLVGQRWRRPEAAAGVLDDPDDEVVRRERRAQPLVARGITALRFRSVANQIEPDRERLCRGQPLEQRGERAVRQGIAVARLIRLGVLDDDDARIDTFGCGQPTQEGVVDRALERRQEAEILEPDDEKQGEVDEQQHGERVALALAAQGCRRRPEQPPLLTASCR